MLVETTRRVSAFSARALFLAALFVGVIFLHVAVTSGLRSAGVNGGVALFISGALVLILVLTVDWTAKRYFRLRDAAREAERRLTGLPDGPCCVIWRKGEAGRAPMPWRLATPMRAPYPRLAQRLGVEGLAVLDFEIGTNGAAKHVVCVQSWPNQQFFEAAAAALAQARFEPKPGETPTFGTTYRMPFLFRIEGAAGGDAQSFAQRFRRHADSLCRAGQRISERVSPATFRKSQSF